MNRSRAWGCLAVFAAGFAVWLAGCDGSGVPGINLGDFLGESGSGELRMLVTDCPFPYEYIAEAWVTITRVEVFRARGIDADDFEPDGVDPNCDESLDEDDPNACDDPNDTGDPNQVDEPLGDDDPNGVEDGAEVDEKDASTAKPTAGGDEDEVADDADDAVDPNDGDAGDELDDDDQSSGNPFKVVFEDPEGQEINLLELRNGRVTELFEADLQAGFYTKVRIIVSGGRVVLTDGREFPLRVPSGDRSGIKLRVDFEVSPGGESELLLDFDLSKSFVPVPGGAIAKAGDIREFKFRPSYGMRIANRSQAGDLSGQVVDDEGEPVENVAVTAYCGDEEIGNTATEEDGSYAFLGLSPGQYRLRFEGSGYRVRELHNRQIRVGEESEDENVELESDGDADAAPDEPAGEDADDPNATE